jgi:hypothetical protein
LQKNKNTQKIYRKKQKGAQKQFTKAESNNIMYCVQNNVKKVGK